MNYLKWASGIWEVTDKVCGKGHTGWLINNECYICKKEVT